MLAAMSRATSGEPAGAGNRYLGNIRLAVGKARGGRELMGGEGQGPEETVVNLSLVGLNLSADPIVSLLEEGSLMRGDCIGDTEPLVIEPIIDL